MSEFDTASRACYETFVSTTRKMAVIDANIKPYEIDRFLTDIRGLLHEQTSPNYYFDPIAAGAYKECYCTSMENWVIKFASGDNPTEAEQQILNLAKEWGIGKVFLPTFFIKLPNPLPMGMLDPSYCCNYGNSCESPSCTDCSYNVEVEGSKLTYAIIQMRAIVQTDLSFDDFYDHDYNKFPLHFNDGALVDEFFVLRLEIKSITWLGEAIRIYGDAFVKRLYEFVVKFDISDLHNDNIGYVSTSEGEMPIILDWMSYCG